MSYMRVLPCWETPCLTCEQESKAVSRWPFHATRTGAVLCLQKLTPKALHFPEEKTWSFFSSSKDILTLNDGGNSWLWSSFCWVWGPHCWWCHQKPTWRWSYWDSVKHYFDSLSTWLCQIPLQRMSDRLLRNNSMWAFGSAWENTYQKFPGISFSPNLNNLFFTPMFFFLCPQTTTNLLDFENILAPLTKPCGSFPSIPFTAPLVLLVLSFLHYNCEFSWRHSHWHSPIYELFHPPIKLLKSIYLFMFGVLNCTLGIQKRIRYNSCFLRIQTQERDRQEVSEHNIVLHLLWNIYENF